MKRALGAAVAASILVAAHGGGARADAVDTILTSGYVLSLGLSGISTAVNGSALAYDQPSSRGWRILGMTSGAIDLGVGTGILITTSDKSAGIVLGSLAIAFGAAALTTGYFASEDAHVGVIQVSGGGLLTVGGRF